MKNQRNWRVKCIKEMFETNWSKNWRNLRGRSVVILIRSTSADYNLLHRHIFSLYWIFPKSKRCLLNLKSSDLRLRCSWTKKKTKRTKLRTMLFLLVFLKLRYLLLYSCGEEALCLWLPWQFHFCPIWSFISYLNCRVDPILNQSAPKQTTVGILK